MGQEDKGARASLLVPDSTKENHLEDLAHAASTRGISIGEAVKQKVTQWRAHHDLDPTAGWDRLADWLESAPVAAASKPVEVEVEKAVDKAPRTTRGAKTAR